MGLVGMMICIFFRFWSICGAYRRVSYHHRGSNQRISKPALLTLRPAHAYLAVEPHRISHTKSTDRVSFRGSRFPWVSLFLISA
uniref:Putative secreted protein n=1 Tax=Anopheles triannulatus TaxID=58253 RepID=A0A2M4B7H7_9DIPT